MCGNGVGIGTEAVIIPKVPDRILQAPYRATSGFYGAEAGTTALATPELQITTATTRTRGATLTGSAWSAVNDLSASPEPEWGG